MHFLDIMTRSEKASLKKFDRWSGVTMISLHLLVLSTARSSIDLGVGMGVNYILLNDFTV
jgi:hypothetical protein